MQLAGLGDGVVLLAGVNDEQGAGETLHVLDAAEILLELGHLAHELHDFLLGKHVEGAVLLHALELSKTVDTGAHGLEVGEHAAQPTGVDVVLADALGLLLYGLGGLLLGADEQDVLAVGGEVADEVVGLFELLDGLLQVDDVDAVTLAVNVLGHLGVPAAGLVTEVYAGLQKLLHGYYCHFCVSSFILLLPPKRVASPRPSDGFSRRHGVGDRLSVCNADIL